jgi:hypothetical protein
MSSTTNLGHIGTLHGRESRNVEAYVRKLGGTHWPTIRSAMSGVVAACAGAGEGTFTFHPAAKAVASKARAENAEPS